MGLTDSCDRLFAVFVGGPDGDESWPAVVEGAQEALSCAKRSIRFSWKQDRRGTFKTVATGLSYGGGQMVGDSIHFLSASLSEVRNQDSSDIQRVI